MKALMPRPSPGGSARATPSEPRPASLGCCRGSHTISASPSPTVRPCRCGCWRRRHGAPSHVALSGDGGDEGFAGYSWYAAADGLRRAADWVPPKVAAAGASLLQAAPLRRSRVFGRAGRALAMLGARDSASRFQRQRAVLLARGPAPAPWTGPHAVLDRLRACRQRLSPNVRLGPAPDAPRRSRHLSRRRPHAEGRRHFDGARARRLRAPTSP